MGKDGKEEAERQRCLQLKRKNEFTKYRASYAYAQRKSPGLVEALEAEQATSKMVDSSTADFTHWLIQTAEAATPTNVEAPILGFEDLFKTTEAATATNLKAQILEPEDFHILRTTEAATSKNPKPPTMGLDAAYIGGFVAELSGIIF